MKRLTILILVFIAIAASVNSVYAENQGNKSEQSIASDKEPSCDQINSFINGGISSWHGFVHFYGLKYRTNAQNEFWFEKVKIEYINPYNVSIVSDRPQAVTYIEECIVHRKSDQEMLTNKRVRIVLSETITSEPREVELWKKMLQEYREWYDKRYSTNTSPSS